MSPKCGLIFKAKDKCHSNDELSLFIQSKKIKQMNQLQLTKLKNIKQMNQLQLN